MDVTFREIRAALDRIPPASSSLSKREQAEHILGVYRVVVRHLERIQQQSVVENSTTGSWTTFLNTVRQKALGLSAEMSRHGLAGTLKEFGPILEALYGRRLCAAVTQKTQRRCMSRIIPGEQYCATHLGMFLATKRTLSGALKAQFPGTVIDLVVSYRLGYP